MIRSTEIEIDTTRTPLIRWGSVVAGAVWGLAVMAVLATLWLALAFPSGVDVVRDNIEWFMAGSGALALFIAGVVAGALTDNRGPSSGWLHGMTAWGLLLIGALVFGVPSAFGLFSAGQLRTIQGGDLVGAGANDAMWATFFTLVVGAALAGLGGAMGAAPRRSVGTAGSRVPGADEDWADRRIDDDDARRAYPAQEYQTTDSDRIMVKARRYPTGRSRSATGRICRTRSSPTVAPRTRPRRSGGSSAVRASCTPRRNFRTTGRDQTSRSSVTTRAARAPRGPERP